MPSLPLLLLLASLPCAEREDITLDLRETAEHRPAGFADEVSTLSARLGGIPLPPAQDGDTTPERAEQIARFLKEACDVQALANNPNAVSPPPTEPERLEAILDRPEFARARQRHGDALKRIMREVTAWLEGLFESREAQGFAVATRAVMLGLALALILWGVLRLRARRGRRAARVSASSATSAEPLVLDSPAEHLRRARAALSTDAREAIREGLLSLLSSLEEQRLARPDRVRTNRELAAELPGRGAPAALVREVERLMGWYDRTFYSLAPVAPEDAARFVTEVESLNGTLATEGAR
ncbi:DUF4129 domain-containing protein [Myxococcus xanthus]|uniref:Protein-glutamine gamma-glutamyltransferase-like C-terminal domain-containing protein n=1 Tax=Myxococcus xanthus TaxID=34 RepID=A0AAE6G053_MYXXA|nr:DUF4129 domain-containing protein [Myxococcus xanthus]QDE68357.1 hypothetical protein BHS09_15980 [Myxococcus xanthus]QDE75634.1 hypothetical protein BHS08_15995 [Myxococcus xanthus]QDE82961.1 hypothetical protein BHS07_16155 [Myxococcus xanthus]